MRTRNGGKWQSLQSRTRNNSTPRRQERPEARVQTAAWQEHLLAEAPAGISDTVSPTYACATPAAARVLYASCQVPSIDLPALICTKTKCLPDAQLETAFDIAWDLISSHPTCLLGTTAAFLTAASTFFILLADLTAARSSRRTPCGQRNAGAAGHRRHQTCALWHFRGSPGVAPAAESAQKTVFARSCTAYTSSSLDQLLRPVSPFQVMDAGRTAWQSA